MSSPSVSNQLHSFHQPIASNGLFWTTAIPDDALRISRDGRTAEFKICNYPIIDQPTFPLPGPTYKARISLTIQWRGETTRVGWTNPAQRFQILFRGAVARVAFEAHVPSLDFSFVSDAASTSRSLFAMIGEERNGEFFTTEA